MSESLAEALSKEQARVREMLSDYDTIPGGTLAAVLMRRSLSAATGDVVAMARAYKDLKGWGS